MSKRQIVAMTMKIDGLRNVEKQLKELGAVAGAKVLTKNAMTALEPVLARAKALAPRPGSGPYATGRLRDSLAIAVGKPDGNAVAVAGIKVTRLAGATARRAQTLLRHVAGAQRKSMKRELQREYPYYWLMVEKGTARTRAQPFIRPAFDQGASGMVVAFRDEIRKDIRDIIAKRFRLSRKMKARAQAAQSRVDRSRQRRAKATRKALNKASKTTSRVAKQQVKQAKALARAVRRSLRSRK